jgi:hypothetical protein
MGADERETLLAGWSDALGRARSVRAPEGAPREIG